MRGNTRWSTGRATAARFLTGSLLIAVAAPLSAETKQPEPRRLLRERLIAGVALSKREVCPNEPVTVTVKTRGNEARAAGVYLSVNGKVGNPVAVSFGSEGTYELVAEAFDKKGRIDQRSSQLRVVECGPAERLRVDARPLSLDRVALRVETRLHRAPPRSEEEQQARREERQRYVPPAIAAYHWDFGDGESADTVEPYAEHSYESRDQRSVVTVSYVVHVTATAEDGREIEGSTHVTLSNVYAQNRIEHGVIVPPVSIAEAGAEQGGSAPKLTLRNLEDVSLSVQRIVLHRIPCDSGAEPSRMEIAPEAFLGHSVFEPGPTTVELVLTDEIASAGTCRVVVDAEGETAAGQPMRFSVGMSTGIAEPAGSPLQEVVGGQERAAAKTAELTEAARLLGRDPSEAEIRITDDELRLLRMQGRLGGGPVSRRPGEGLSVPAAPEPGS